MVKATARQFRDQEEQRANRHHELALDAHRMEMDFDSPAQAEGAPSGARGSLDALPPGYIALNSFPSSAAAAATEPVLPPLKVHVQEKIQQSLTKRAGPMPPPKAPTQDHYDSREWDEVENSRRNDEENAAMMSAWELFDQECHAQDAEKDRPAQAVASSSADYRWSEVQRTKSASQQYARRYEEPRREPHRLSEAEFAEGFAIQQAPWRSDKEVGDHEQAQSKGDKGKGKGQKRKAPDTWDSQWTAWDDAPWKTQSWGSYESKWKR